MPDTIPQFLNQTRKCSHWWQFDPCNSDSLLRLAAQLETDGIDATPIFRFVTWLTTHSYAKPGDEVEDLWRDVQVILSRYALRKATGAGKGKRDGDTPPGAAATHGPDFRDVKWNGANHIFSPKQAACIRVLWEAWEQGNPFIADGTVLQKAGVGDRQRLRDVFRKHAAWGTMILQGAQQDLHGLQEISVKT